MVGSSSVPWLCTVIHLCSCLSHVRSSPVLCISGSAAAEVGLLAGSCLLRVGKNDVLKASHDAVVSMIKACIQDSSSQDKACQNNVKHSQDKAQQDKISQDKLSQNKEKMSQNNVVQDKASQEKGSDIELRVTYSGMEHMVSVLSLTLGMHGQRGSYNVCVCVLFCRSVFYHSSNSMDHF